MELFIDTAEVPLIEQYNRLGIIRGVTTNPSLIAKSGRDFHTVIGEICQLVDGPISAEVIATDVEGMIREAEILSAIHPRVVVKIPFGEAGLEASYRLKAKGIRSNVTLVFSANQALMAASAGADFISPFAGRLDDIGHDGIGMILECIEVVEMGSFSSRIIGASIRSPAQVVRLAREGGHIATLPPAILKAMMQHPLTDLGLQKFLEDWESAKKEGRA